MLEAQAKIPSELQVIERRIRLDRAGATLQIGPDGQTILTNPQGKQLKGCRGPVNPSVDPLILTAISSIPKITRKRKVE